MKFAQIITGLPINRAFDYSIPSNIKDAALGSRILIDFANKKKVGYIVGFKNRSNVKKVKPIIRLVDQVPLLSKNLLKFTKSLSEYYFCSWGQMIEAALPRPLRIGKSIALEKEGDLKSPRAIQETFIVFDSGSELRFDFYFEKIKETLGLNKQIIILAPDVGSTVRIQQELKKRFDVEISILNRYKKTKESIISWSEIYSGKTKIIVGTFSAIFAPCNNLGLIIIDEEDNQTYKQEQTPFYHTRKTAIIRANIEKCPIALGGKTISLEAYHFLKLKQAKLIYFKKEALKEVIAIDMNREFYRIKKGEALSGRLENEIISILGQNSKIGIFLNRQGFATTLKCNKCGFILKCERCNINLTYNFKTKNAYCRYCNYKIEPQNLCPNCKTSYLSYRGIGREKLESYLHCKFPHAKIQFKETENTSANIFILDKRDIQKNITFENIAIVSADILLNLADFDAAEKTFSLAYRLYSLANKKLFIQTFLPNHYCWQALKNNEPFLFYKKELKLRKQLKFPPFWNFIRLSLRGKNEDKVKQKCLELLDHLKTKIFPHTEIYPPQQANPAKLRGNFYWQILLKTKDVLETNSLLRKSLGEINFSNMILTVNVDP